MYVFFRGLAIVVEVDHLLRFDCLRVDVLVASSRGIIMSFGAVFGHDQHLGGRAFIVLGEVEIVAPHVSEPVEAGVLGEWAADQILDRRLEHVFLAQFPKIR